LCSKSASYLITGAGFDLRPLGYEHYDVRLRASPLSRRVPVDLGLVLVVVAGLGVCPTSSRRDSLAIPLAEQAVDQHKRTGFVSAPRRLVIPSPSAHPTGKRAKPHDGLDGTRSSILEPEVTAGGEVLGAWLDILGRFRKISGLAACSLIHS